MLSTIRRILGDLRHNKSGNAMLLVALGMPVLIGTSGLAVDSAQYYMWKRDLQFAVDQAALAGAWARTTTATQSTYQSRALQEYNANVQNSADFDSGPTTTLVNYNSGTQNAVKVVASATKRLPFTNIVTGRSVTVSVTATASATQAGNSVTTTTTYNTLTACMITLPDRLRCLHDRRQRLGIGRLRRGGTIDRPFGGDPRKWQPQCVIRPVGGGRRD